MLFYKMLITKIYFQNTIFQNATYKMLFAKCYLQNAFLPNTSNKMIVKKMNQIQSQFKV